MTHGWKYTNTNIVETEDIVKSPNLQKNNITATTDPTVSNDSSEGYSQGSLWINHTGETIWLCSDASVGAAVWFQVSGSGFYDTAIYNSIQLERVDDNTLETAQEEVEYFSPDQQGGVWGKVVRQYFSGTTSATTVTVANTSAGVSHSIKSGGYIELGSERLPLGYFTASGNYDISQIRSASGGLYFVVGSSLTSHNYVVWVDYIKTTEPTTSPTNLLLNNPYLQRVDTGLWEIPQDNVEYYSPRQYLDTDVKCIKYTLSSPTNDENYNSFSTQPAVTPTMIWSIEGYLTNASGRKYNVQAINDDALKALFVIDSGDLKYNIDTSFSGGLNVWIHYV
jgi:hypothetical protein